MNKSRRRAKPSVKAWQAYDLICDRKQLPRLRSWGRRHCVRRHIDGFTAGLASRLNRFVHREHVRAHRGQHQDNADPHPPVLVQSAALRRCVLVLVPAVMIVLMLRHVIFSRTENARVPGTKLVKYYWKPAAFVTAWRGDVPSIPCRGMAPNIDPFAIEWVGCRRQDRGAFHLDEFQALARPALSKSSGSRRPTRIAQHSPSSGRSVACHCWFAQQCSPRA